MAINKSASKIGTIEFKNGNKTVLYIGSNSNTGTTIVWQRTNGAKSRRVTGKNINRLAGELVDVLARAEGRLVGEINHAALDCLTKLAA